VKAVCSILRAFVSLCDFLLLHMWTTISHKGTKARWDRDDEFGVLMTHSLCVIVVSCETLICEPLDSVFEQRLTKVDQQTEAEVGQFQVGEQLLCVNWCELFDRLQFNDEAAVDDQVRAKPISNSSPSKSTGIGTSRSTW